MQHHLTRVASRHKNQRISAEARATSVDMSGLPVFQKSTILAEAPVIFASQGSGQGEYRPRLSQHVLRQSGRGVTIPLHNAPLRQLLVFRKAHGNSRAIVAAWPPSSLWTTNPRPQFSATCALRLWGDVTSLGLSPSFLNPCGFRGSAGLVRSHREERYHCSFPLHRRRAARGCAGVARISEAPIGVPSSARSH